jgi:PAS domain S-box-containing protein
MNLDLLLAIFDSLPIAIFVKDQNHRYIYVNSLFAHHSGHSRERCIGRTDREFQNTDVVEELGQSFEDTDNAVLQQGETVESVFTYDVAGAKPTPFLTRKSRLITADGNSYILGTCTDVSRVSDLEAINARVIALNTELASKVAELRSAQDEMIRRGKMAQLGQLTATVAHELRNPLGAVRTSAFLLERKLKGKDLGVESQFERINNGITRCDSTITQLLDFARSTKLELKPTKFDDWLSTLLVQEAQTLPTNLTITLDLGMGDREVGIDPARLSRAVINLLSNASEAMLGKAGAPVNSTDDAHVTVTTRLTPRGAELCVSDNGPGMSEEVLLRIREPLFTTKSFGTGLGVPAIEQIAQQHGGDLEIWSEPNKGARFTIWWPLQKQKDDAVAAVA